MNSVGGQILFYFFVGIIFYLMYEIFLHSNFTRFLMLAGQNSFLSVGGKKGARKWLVLSIKKKTHTHLLGQSWRLLITYWKFRFFLQGKKPLFYWFIVFQRPIFFGTLVESHLFSKLRKYLVAKMNFSQVVLKDFFLKWSFVMMQKNFSHRYWHSSQMQKGSKCTFGKGHKINGLINDVKFFQIVSNLEGYLLTKYCKKIFKKNIF